MYGHIYLQDVTVRIPQPNKLPEEITQSCVPEFLPRDTVRGAVGARYNSAVGIPCARTSHRFMAARAWYRRGPAPRSTNGEFVGDEQ